MYLIRIEPWSILANLRLQTKRLRMWRRRRYYDYLSILNTRCFYLAAGIVTSRRGKPLISVGGFTFCFKRKVNDAKQCWVCSSHNNRGCKAVLYTLDGIIVRLNNSHNHCLSKTSQSYDYVKGYSLSDQK